VTKLSSDPDVSQERDAYTVLARRYRPQTFLDLVGQEPVARALTNAIKSSRVAHAYIFTGARGVGKTSTARILAKALNCVNGPTETPCGVCEICQSIATGEDVDVLEIDGASNNGVENIRDIRSNVQYRPQRTRFKIYIIDEVHMLSKAAFNAILKTLEEPPPHVKFIFATTEIERVPITILSRCQRFDFSGISTPRIVERLQSIVEQENMQAEPEALELIARRAGGSMRDAQSLLDQLLAFSQDRLTTDQVHHLLGTAGDERILNLADAVLSKDAKRALDLLSEACTTGLQLGELIEQLVAYWRDLMIISCGGIDGRDLSVPARHHKRLEEQAKQTPLDAILAGLDVLASTKVRLHTSNHSRTLVEMALVRLSRLADLSSLSQLSQWLGQMRLDPRAAVGGPPTVGHSQSVRNPPGESEGLKKKPLTPGPEPGKVPAAPGTSPNAVAPQTGPMELTVENWPAIRQQIGDMVGNMLGSQLARANSPAIIGPNSLVFRMAAAYNSVREYLTQPERTRKIEEALLRITGRAWNLKFESEQEAQASQSVQATEAVLAPKPKANPKEEAEKLPLIKRAIEVLGATIQRADDQFGEATTQKPKTSNAEES
jgi:DNA polymerase-3 subunit gamma/tau